MTEKKQQRRKLPVMLLGIPVYLGVLTAVWRPVLLWLRIWAPWIAGWLFWPVVGALVFSMSLSYMLPKGRFSSFLHMIGEAVMAPHMTLAALVIPADIVWLFWRELPLEETGWAVLAAFFAMCTAGVVNSFRVKTRRCAVSVDKPCPKLRLVLISDLHLGAFTGRKMVGRIVRAVIKAVPDAVVIAGDLFDDRFEDIRRPDEAAKELGRLAALCPVFACEGNHDLFQSTPERESFIKTSGVRLFLDETENFHGVTFAFCRDARNGERIGAEALLSGAVIDAPIVAVDHNPAGIKSLWDAGADLVLSGHTHGGQTFPGNLLYRLAPVHSYGVKKRDGKTAIVTSGVGFYGTPIRLGVDNEVVVIEITGTEK